MTVQTGRGLAATLCDSNLGFVFLVSVSDGVRSTCSTCSTQLPKSPFCLTLNQALGMTNVISVFHS